MKKIIGILILLLGIYPIYQASADIQHRIVDIIYKSGGTLGDDGKTRYGKVIVIDLWLFRFVSCTGGGADVCPEDGIIKGATNEEMVAVQEARNYAKNKITNNILQGQEDLPSGLTVKWSSQTNNPDNCGECEIKIWKTGEPEPTPPNQ
jgi:hypothetical protein